AMERLARPRSVSRRERDEDGHSPESTERSRSRSSRRETTRDARSQREYLTQLSTGDSQRRERRRLERKVALENSLAQDMTFSPHLHAKKERKTQTSHAKPHSSSADGYSTVFQRLHTQAQARQRRLNEKRAKAVESEIKSCVGRPELSRMTRGMTESRNSDGYANYGERLYQEAQQREETHKAKVKALKEQEEQEEVQHPFKPVISKMAQKLDLGAEDTFHRQEKLNEQAKTKLVARRAEADEAELDGCTFKPTINENAPATRRALKGREDSATHELLYKDAERRLQRQREYTHWFPADQTFHPDTTNTTRYLENRQRQEDGRVVPGLEHDPETRIERLMASKEQREQRLQQLRMETEEPPQPRTHVQPQRGMATTEYLYQNRHEAEAIRQRLVEEADARAALLSSVIHTPHSSEQILRQFRRRRFHSIFQTLDTDEDGVIEPYSAEWGLIPEDDVRRDVADALSHVDQPIGLSDFVAIVEADIQRRQFPRKWLIPQRSFAGSHTESN
ncbi:hypothetical protein KIPB_010922, partial [Kipferlia bialata]